MEINALSKLPTYQGYDFSRDVFVIKSLRTREGKEYESFALAQGPRNMAEGWVYVLESHPNIYKIGRSVDYKRRHGQLAIVLPFEAKLVSAIETDDMLFGEYVLHHVYKEKRLKGEWFSLTPEDVEDLKGVDCMVWATPSELALFLEDF